MIYLLLAYPRLHGYWTHQVVNSRLFSLLLFLCRHSLAEYEIEYSTRNYIDRTSPLMTQLPLLCSKDNEFLCSLYDLRWQWVIVTFDEGTGSFRVDRLEATEAVLISLEMKFPCLLLLVVLQLLLLFCLLRFGGFWYSPFAVTRFRWLLLFVGVFWWLLV